jgi:hypothetical protein
MAPNQRDPNKQMLRVWVEKDRLAIFRRRAEALGMSMSSLVTAFIIEETNKQLKEDAKRNNR